MSCSLLSYTLSSLCQPGLLSPRPHFSIFFLVYRIEKGSFLVAPWVKEQALSMLQLCGCCGLRGICSDTLPTPTFLVLPPPTPPPPSRKGGFIFFCFSKKWGPLLTRSAVLLLDGFCHLAVFCEVRVAGEGHSVCVCPTWCFGT